MPAIFDWQRAYSFSQVIQFVTNRLKRLLFLDGCISCLACDKAKVNVVFFEGRLVMGSIRHIQNTSGDMKLLFKQLLCALQQGSKCPAQWVTMMIEILPLKNSTSLGFNLLYLIYCRKNLLYRNEVKRGNDALIEGNDIHEVQKKKQRWTCYHSIETKILRRLYLV